jgi:hypothetical protein
MSAEDGSVPEACGRVALALQHFDQPPFTVQRLCELLADPCRHYASRQKLQAAVEKLCAVSSTTVTLAPPPPPPPTPTPTPTPS